MKKDEESTWYNFNPQYLYFICMKIAYKVIHNKYTIKAEEEWKDMNLNVKFNHKPMILIGKPHVVNLPLTKMV